MGKKNSSQGDVGLENGLLEQEAVQKKNKGKAQGRVRREMWAEVESYIGSTVLLSRMYENHNVKCKIVGASTYKYVIIEMPLVPGFRSTYSEGGTVVVKLVKSGVVCGFYSTILTHIFKPNPLLFITYPKQIEYFELREHKRYLCNIPAQIELNDMMVDCIIGDISVGGCSFFLKQNESDIGAKLVKDALTVNREVKISFQAHGETSVDMKLYVRNITEKDRMVSAGAVFGSDLTSSVFVNEFVSMLEGYSR